MTYQMLWKKATQLFWPDIIFFMIVVLCIVFGLVLFLLSHVLMVWKMEPGLTPSLTVLDLPFSLPSLSLLDATSTLHQNAVTWLDQPKSIFDFTDPSATYDNPAVKELWGVLLFIADSIISVFMILAGYQVLFAGFSSRYSEALEALPNLIFAAIGANISLIFARFWIDLNNMLCALLLAQAHTENHPMSGLGALGLDAVLALLVIPLLLILTLLMIMLGVQMAARLGVILFLTVLLAVLFALLADRRTQRFGQAGLTAYVTAVLLQFLQLLCITIGGKVLLPFLSANIGPADGIAPFVSILAGIALLWITLRIPSMLRNWALAPVADSTQALRTILVGSLTRAVFHK